jgi:hypothetical protein
METKQHTRDFSFSQGAPLLGKIEHERGEINHRPKKITEDY